MKNSKTFNIFKIVLPIILLLIGIFTSIGIFSAVVAFYLIFLFFTNRQVLFKLKSKYFLSFIVVLLLIYPLFGESHDFQLPFSIGYDLNYLAMSVQMSLRAILLFGFSNVLLLNISTGNLLSKLKFANSDEIIQIAMNSYENVAKKTLDHFKSFDYKKIKIHKTIDYIAIFMADLLSDDIIYNSMNNILDKNEE